MHPWIARNLVYRPIQFLRGEKFVRYLEEVRAFNRLSAAEMQQEQWLRLKALLDYVYGHNDYYHRILDELNLPPVKITSPDDFKKLPLLTKMDLQQHSGEMLSRDRGRVDHRKTSGSTGTPYKFVKDRRSLAFMNAVMHDCYSWHGIEIGDRQCRIWAIPQELKPRLIIFIKDTLMNRIRLNSFDVNDDSSVKFFHDVRKFKPKFMYGVPSYMTDFSRRLQEHGLDPKDMGLEVLICTGEILFPAQKKLLKETYDCTIANEYGTTESGIVAFSCPHDNMHLMSHALYVEIIDPETGEKTRPGEIGEVVFTDLNSRTMPFIRYKVGDTAIPKAGTCSCGIQLPMVEHVEGRLEDMIETPEGKKVAGGMLYYTLTKGIQQFKAYQRAIDHLHVLIEPGPGFSEGDLERIRDQWRTYLGNRMKVTFEIVDRIPPDRSGKLRYFVPETDPDYVIQVKPAGTGSDRLPPAEENHDQK